MVRMRRLREKEGIRRMIRETHLTLDDLVYPLFVAPGERVRKEIPSMPRNHHISVDLISEEAKTLYDLGIPAVILFGLPETKDPFGSEAWHEDGIVQRAVRAIKKAVSDLVVITDVCLCQYTSTGHCGLVDSSGTRIENDPSCGLLAEVALSHALAGADIVAPSDMMDGRVQAIRRKLDDAGFPHVLILSYAAKYASSFYGPFREAADSAPQFGDRRSYQMDPANSDQALREVELDLDEGADIVMVKPALAYGDVIRRVKDRFRVPVAAYNVSGEYAMIEAAAERGWIDRRSTVLEVLTSLKRAGADIIITYYARDVARWLRDG
ncbi:MAG: porphobilinogen synthase [Firmicutes bacterium]|nr:porphobilinogen synthase [Bacillota bacterium]